MHETLESDFQALGRDNLEESFSYKELHFKKSLPASCENQIPWTAKNVKHLVHEIFQIGLL